MKKKIIVAAVTSAVTFLVLLGVTYAYFTATINGTNSSATVTTATLGSVGYTTSVPTGTNVLPGWSGEGSTSVYLTTSSDKSVKYRCTVALQSDSYSTNVYIQTTGGSDAQVSSMTALTTSGVVVSEGILSAEEVASGNHGTAHNVTYNVIFNETGAPQNTDQEQNIKVEATCALLDNEYSNNAVLSGIVYDENNQPLANQAMVAFSSPTYFTTDATGHYSVTLPSGNHEIYYVPNMSMQDLQAAGDSIKTNVNVKSVEINTTVSNISFVKYAVSVSCTGCIPDSASKNIGAGQTASFTITPSSGYSLTGASVTGNGCVLSGNTLSVSNVSSAVSCSVAAVSEVSYVYWSYPQSVGTYYTTSTKPATTSNDYSTLGLSGTYGFIRTSVDGNDNVLGHELCIHYNDNNSCFGLDVFEHDAYFDGVTPELKNVLEDDLGITFYNNTSSMSLSEEGSQIEQYNDFMISIGKQNMSVYFGYGGIEEGFEKSCAYSVYSANLAGFVCYSH